VPEPTTKPGGAKSTLSTVVKTTGTTRPTAIATAGAGVVGASKMPVAAGFAAAVFFAGAIAL
jgi:hypothetical protein